MSMRWESSIVAAWAARLPTATGPPGHGAEDLLLVVGEALLLGLPARLLADRRAAEDSLEFGRRLPAL